MGSVEEFKHMLQFVNQHKIVPIIDTVIDGLDNAGDGFVSVCCSLIYPCRRMLRKKTIPYSQPLLQDADKRSGGKVIVKIAEATEKSKL